MVFLLPHIHWRRVCDKVEEILKDSAIKNVHRLRLRLLKGSTALRGLSTAMVKLLKIWDRRTFLDSVVDSLVDTCEYFHNPI